MNGYEVFVHRYVESKDGYELFEDRFYVTEDKFGVMVNKQENEANTRPKQRNCGDN